MELGSIDKIKKARIILQTSLTGIENRDQVLYVNNIIKKKFKVINKICEAEAASESDKELAKIFTFSYILKLYQLIKDGDTSDNIGVVITQLVNTSEQGGEILKAIADLTVPISKQAPVGILIGSDAINASMGKGKFINYVQNIKNELEYYFDHAQGELEWSEIVLDYMSNTKFYTMYAKRKYLDKKIKNKSKLVKYTQRVKRDSSLVNNKQAMTMIKTSSRNQVDLVNIADNKAGIMITINSILLTILIPLFASYIFDMSSYILPMSLLAVTCGVTIILATLATRPPETTTIESDDMKSGKRSIFYFKNFSKLKKAEFLSEVEGVLARDSAFEKTVFTDLYDVGVELNHKYTRLRWCYTVFGIGMLLTMISFLFCIFYFSAT